MNPGFFVCGCYGDYNLGDEAMLAGYLTLLDNVTTRSNITVFSKEPQETQARHQISTFPRSVLNRKQQLLSLFETQAIAIAKRPYFALGGGDLIRDSQDYEVAEYWLGILQQAIALRRKTMVLGVSAGEVWKTASKQIIQNTLNQVNLLAVRDELSKAKLQSLGVEREIHVMGDLALEAWNASLDAAANSPSEPGHNNEQNLKIGFVVRPISGRGLSSEQVDSAKLRQTIARLIDYCADELDATVHLIPFQSKEWSFHFEDDYVEILEILRYAKSSQRCQVYRYVPSLESLHSILNSLDIMIGMRLHSLILSAGLGIPVLALEYDPKVKGFMQEIGQPDASFPLATLAFEDVRKRLHLTVQDLSSKKQFTKVGCDAYRTKTHIIQEKIKSLIAT